MGAQLDCRLEAFRKGTGGDGRFKIIEGEGGGVRRSVARA